MKFALANVLDITAHAVYNVLLACGSVTLVIGLLLVFNSPMVFRLNEKMNLWISTRALLRPLERPREVHHHLYQRHRLAGTALIAAALYALYVLLTQYRPEPIVSAYRDVMSPAAMSWVVDSLHVGLVAGSTLVLAAGAALLIAPDRLRSLEIWTDRQISARQATKRAETLNYSSDAFIRSHPTLVGSLVTLASLYVLLSLAFFWHL